MTSHRFSFSFTTTTRICSVDSSSPAALQPHTPFCPTVVERTGERGRVKRSVASGRPSSTPTPPKDGEAQRENRHFLADKS